MSKIPVQRAARIVAAGIPYGPRANPCVCSCGQHAHSGKQATGRCQGSVWMAGTIEDCTCSRYRPDPAWELAYRAVDTQFMKLGHQIRAADELERKAHSKSNPYTAGEWRLGPSDAATCRRAIWYKNMPPAGLKLDPSDGREARIGTIIHEGVVKRLQALYPWQMFEQKVKVRGLDRPGKYDRFDPVVCEVEDFKTAGDWAWDQVDDYGPFEGAWAQGFLYGLALHEAGQEVRTIRLTYLKRCNGHDQTFVEDFDVERAERYRQELLAIATALDIVHAEMERSLAENPKAAYDPGEALPRDRSGPSTDKICARCPFRSHCWNLKQAEDLGRSGESLTMLGATPEDEAIAEALQQNVEAKELYRDAEKAKDETATWFDGLEPGRYGDFRLEMSQDYGSKPQYKQHVDELHQRILAGEPIDPETLEIPKGPEKRYLQAKRMQKAVLAKEKRERDRLKAAAEAAAADLPEPATQEVGA